MDLREHALLVGVMVTEGVRMHEVLYHCMYGWLPAQVEMRQNIGRGQPRRAQHHKSRAQRFQIESTYASLKRQLVHVLAPAGPIPAGPSVGDSSNKASTSTTTTISQAPMSH